MQQPIASTPLRSTELFGGAMDMLVPEGFFDVSNFKKVPDNQEVFAATEGDSSIIVELMELVEDWSDEDSAKNHFHEIAQLNNAEGESVTFVHKLANSDIPNFQSDVYGSVVTGVQKICKFRERVANDVQMFMAIIRLRQVSTDLMITYNFPIKIDENSSSAAVAFNSQLASANNDNSSNNAEAPQNQQAWIVFGQILSSLKINDWGLFESAEMEDVSNIAA